MDGRSQRRSLNAVLPGGFPKERTPASHFTSLARFQAPHQKQCFQKLYIAITGLLSPSEIKGGESRPNLHRVAMTIRASLQSFFTKNSCQLKEVALVFST